MTKILGKGRQDLGARKARSWGKEGEILGQGRQDLGARKARSWGKEGKILGQGRQDLGARKARSWDKEGKILGQGRQDLEQDSKIMAMILVQDLGQEGKELAAITLGVLTLARILTRTLGQEFFAGYSSRARVN